MNNNILVGIIDFLEVANIKYTTSTDIENGIELLSVYPCMIDSGIDTGNDIVPKIEFSTINENIVMLENRYIERVQGFLTTSHIVESVFHFITETAHFRIQIESTSIINGKVYITFNDDSKLKCIFSDLVFSNRKLTVESMIKKLHRIKCRDKNKKPLSMFDSIVRISLVSK